MTPEEIKKIQEELNGVFTTIQKIDAPMTENNVAVMNACLGSIKYIYNFIEEIKEKGGSGNGDADAE